MRNIVIGDIHGCATLLNKLLFDIIQVQPSDQIITLGDYIDRGPNSHGVVQTLIDLKEYCDLTCLKGNHEDLLLKSNDMTYQLIWLRNGAVKTIDSYVRSQGLPLDSFSDLNISSIFQVLPDSHLKFFNNCKLYHEDENNIYVHASYNPKLLMQSQTEEDMLWKHVKKDNIPAQHISGKKVWLGHTPQKSHTVTDLGHVALIDVGSARSGYIAAVDTLTGQVWYVS